MRKILFVNNKFAICGIYQFGNTISNLLSKYHNFVGVECDSQEEAKIQIDIHKPDFIFWNYHGHTMRWLTPDFAKRYNSGIACHDYGENWPEVVNIFLDPNYIENGNNFKICRPIPKFERKLDVIPNSVGIWGYAFGHKYYQEIVKLVDSEFLDGIIRLHIPYSTHGDPYGELARRHAEECRAVKQNNRVKLEISHDYKNNEEFLDWLSQNSVNCFLYENVPLTNGHVGLSSSIDWAIAVKRPIAVNNNPMVRHIIHAEPSILINNGIKRIIDNGFEPIDKISKNWNAETLWNDIQRIARYSCEKNSIS